MDLLSELFFQEWRFIYADKCTILTSFLLWIAKWEDLWSESTFYQSERSWQVPDRTCPWPQLFYTLTHWPNGPRQWNTCDVKRIYSCLDIVRIWLLSGIATKSSYFNLPSTDKKWFQEKPRWWTIEHSVH